MNRTRAAAAALLTTALAGAALAVTAGPASAATPARCGNDDLTVTRTFVQGGAGHSWMALIYRNSSTRTCTVAGFPGVDAVTASGHVLAHAARVRGNVPERTVAVRPAGFASASVAWRNFAAPGERSCQTPAAAVETIVANTTRAHRIPVAIGVCGLQVRPTVAGLPGYPAYAQAQHDWLTGASVDAAGMGMFIRDAADELRAAAFYPTQVRQLDQLASFPNTGLTPTQLKEARADVAALDGFFATPNLYA